MLREELQPFVDAAQAIEGWQLAFAPEPLEDGPPWSYEALAAEEIAGASRLLDLGTGGGEVLEPLLAETSCRAVATEQWIVNAPVAAKRLAARAPVARASSLALPFRPGCFDLVLSRHEEVEPAEIGRVLSPSGRFLTQQVIANVWPELRPLFPDMTRFPDHFTVYQAGLKRAGLAIEEAREFTHRVRYRELGHLVYHLAAASPWMLPGFNLEAHAAALDELARWARRDGGVVLTEGFTLIRARM